MLTLCLNFEGIEVIESTIDVITHLASRLGTFQIHFEHLPWGTEYYKKTGRYVSENCLDVLRPFDAILFGSVGAPGKTLQFKCICRTSTDINNL